MKQDNQNKLTKKLWQQSPSPLKICYIDQYAKGQTALDIGTGFGFYAAHLAQKGLHVTAADLEPRPNAQQAIVQARLANLPFSKPFDTVLAFDVLEHEPLEEEALHELRRLTGQRLILSVPNADDGPLHTYNLTYKHHIDKTHQREYQLDELRQKLERHGFRVVAINKEGPVHPAVVAEFFPLWLRPAVRFLFKALFRLRLLKNPSLLADIYVAAEPAA